VAFEVVGAILDQETIAVGRAIRELSGLRKLYGRGRWRKRKGIASLGSISVMARSEQPRSTGAKRMASGAKSSRSSVSSRDRSASRARHVVCLSNDGYGASLERRKIYLAVVDRQAGRVGMVRVVDESGDDYLYPRSFFAEIKVSALLAKALASAT
jgi:hypothetical protein